MLVEYMLLEVIITNQSEVVADLRLYDLIIKKDYISLQSPAGDLASDLTGEQGGTAATRTFPFFNPQSLRAWRDTYRIIKITPVELSPGRTHVHKFLFPVNRVYDTKKLLDQSFTKGLTPYVMAGWKGVPLDDNLSTTLGNVGLAPIKLVFVTHGRVSVRPMESTPKLQCQNNNALFNNTTEYAQTQEHMVNVMTAPSAPVGGGPG